MVTSKTTKIKSNNDTVLKKTVETAMLLDFYGSLLTDRQREYLSLFYEEDFSLGEIGDKFSISRQAVHDTIRHGETQLKEYERHLHLVAKNQARQELIQELKAATGNTSRINELLERLL